MMDGWYKPLKQRFEALQARERVLVILVGAVLVWGLAQVLYFNAEEKREKRLRAANAELRQQLAMLEANEQVLRARLIEEGLTVQQEKLSGLKRQREELDSELRRQGIRLLDPERMREVLHDLLRGSELRLLSVRRLPVEVGYSTEPEEEKSAQAPNLAAPERDRRGITLYRHAIEIDLEGGYTDMVAYLEKLEKSGWRLMWRTLDIETTDYPLARLRLTVYTLSLEEDWIGV
ncbi:MAG: hypothetical protein ACOZAQ_00575 [Pseudomonadota bacterium]